MNRNCSRISARARKHFLQLAAIAFAAGSTGLASAAAATATVGERSAPVLGTLAGDARYRHEFVLARDRAGDLPSARIEVIPLASDDAFTVAAAGACCIGPLQPGPHALRITQGQRIDNHLIRVDESTGAFLHFLA